MLNPWFCALIIDAAARGYEEKLKRPMPLSLVFLILPIILHGETAQVMPATSSAKFANWINDNRRPLAAFPSRAKEMVIFTREALVLGASAGTIRVQGSEISSIKNLKSAAIKTNNSVGKVVTLARRLGAMLAQAGPPATIYALLGVAP